MGFITFVLISLIKLGAFLSGVLCTFQYFRISALAANSIHEITGTLFGIAAILSFGVLAIIILLQAIEEGIVGSKARA